MKRAWFVVLLLFLVGFGSASLELDSSDRVSGGSNITGGGSQSFIIDMSFPYGNLYSFPLACSSNEVSVGMNSTSTRCLNLFSDSPGLGAINSIDTSSSTYLLGGADYGTVVLVLNETVLNNTINSLENDTYVDSGCASGEYVYNISGSVIQCRTDQDTTYTASGTLLDLTGTVFSLNEGTLTDARLCTYVAGSGLVCDTDPNTLNVSDRDWYPSTTAMMLNESFQNISNVDSGIIFGILSGDAIRFYPHADEDNRGVVSINSNFENKTTIGFYNSPEQIYFAGTTTGDRAGFIFAPNVANETIVLKGTTGSGANIWFHRNTGGTGNGIAGLGTLVGLDALVFQPQYDATYNMSNFICLYDDGCQLGMENYDWNIAYINKITNGGTVLVIGNYAIPLTDGSANQILKSDGSGTVSWQNDEDTAYDFECTAGNYVYNLTSDGNYLCSAPSGSGDITSVQGNDPWLYNGSDSGDVGLRYNTTAHTEFTDLNWVRRDDWTSIDDYPTACGSGEFVSAIGDTLTCVADDKGVTAVTGTSPITSTGGNTPDIGITLLIDLEACDGLGGGSNNVLPGTDGDVILRLINCSSGEILKRNAADTAWECATETGGTETLTLSDKFWLDNDSFITDGVVETNKSIRNGSILARHVYASQLRSETQPTSDVLIDMTLSDAMYLFASEYPNMVLTSSASILNPNGVDRDFSAYGLNDNHMLYCDAGLDSCAVGRLPENYKFEVNGSSYIIGDMNASGVICDSNGCIGMEGGSDYTFSDSAWINNNSAISTNGSVNSGNIDVTGNIKLGGSISSDYTLQIKPSGMTDSYFQIQGSEVSGSQYAQSRIQSATGSNVRMQVFGDYTGNVNDTFIAGYGVGGDLRIEHNTGNIYLKPASGKIDMYASSLQNRYGGYVYYYGSNNVGTAPWMRFWIRDDSYDNCYNEVRLETAGGNTAGFILYNSSNPSFPARFDVFNYDGSIAFYSDRDVIFQPYRDTDDYLNFSSDLTNPSISSHGGGVFNLYSDGLMKYTAKGSGGDHNFYGETDVHTDINIYSDRYARIYFNADQDGDGTSGSYSVSLAVTDGSQKGLRLQSATSSAQVFYPETDNTYDLGTSSLRWADVHSVLINGADIGFMNGLALTESINRYNESDICLVLTKPSKEMADAIALSGFDTYEDYYNHTAEPFTEEVYNQLWNMSHDEYGRVDFRFGREVTGCWREMERTTALLEVLKDKAGVTDSEVDSKFKELKRKKKIVNIPKREKGVNVVEKPKPTTTTTTTTTSTTLNDETTTTTTVKNPVGGEESTTTLSASTSSYRVSFFRRIFG